MIARLAGYELRMVRRDPRLWAPLAILAALIVVSFATASLDGARLDADKRAVAAAERARWVGQGTKDPHSAAHYSIFAFKPASALAGLDPGSTPFLGQTVWLEAHHQNDMLYRPQQNASPMQRAGLANPAALILGFGPLVAFLLAFTLAAQERERGTLRLSLGTAVRPWRIVASKSLAVWAAVSGSLAAPVAIAALAVAAFGARLSPDVLARALLWAGLMAAYLGLASLVGVAVALGARNARLALVALFGLWIGFALVLPRAASTAVDTLRPLPSSQAVHQQMLDAAPAYWSAEAAELQKAALLERYKAASLDDIPNPRMAELDMVERHSHQVFDRILGGLYRQVVAQDRLFAVLGLLSPTVAGQSLSAALAGTDFSHHRDFLVTAERYRRDLVNRMNGDGMAHWAHGEERHKNDVRLWSQIPEFRYVDPPLGPVVSASLPALAALIAWLLVALGLTVTAVRRLRP